MAEAVFGCRPVVISLPYVETLSDRRPTPGSR